MTDDTLRAALERLHEAIDGERRHWHRVEVSPDDLRAALAAEAADTSGLPRAALDLLDVIDGVVDDTHPEGDGCPLCSALDDLRNVLERQARLTGPPPRAALATQPAGVDAEGLARAMARVAEVGPPAHVNPDDAEEHWPSYLAEAEEYVAEYARIKGQPVLVQEAGVSREFIHHEDGSIEERHEFTAEAWSRLATQPAGLDDPSNPANIPPGQPCPICGPKGHGEHTDDSYGACVLCREYVPHTDEEFRLVPFPCAIARAYTEDQP